MASRPRLMISVVAKERRVAYRGSVSPSSEWPLEILLWHRTWHPCSTRGISNLKSGTVCSLALNLPSLAFYHTDTFNCFIQIWAIFLSTVSPPPPKGSAIWSEADPWKTDLFIHFYFFPIIKVDLCSSGRNTTILEVQQQPVLPIHLCVQDRRKRTLADSVTLPCHRVPMLLLFSHQNPPFTFANDFSFKMMQSFGRTSLLFPESFPLFYSPWKIIKGTVIQ